MIQQGKRIGALMLITGFICLFPMSRLFGQNSNAGEIRGTVSDSSGAVIPGAVVTIKNVQTGITIKVVTDSTGIYDALSVQPGEYILTFAKEGFGEIIHSPITLRLEIITVDAQLRVGSTTQQITVQAQTPLLQTESSEHSATMTSTEVTELPNVGNSWWRLTTLIPGNVTGLGSGDDIAANGQRGYSGNFLVDGGSATFINTESSGQMMVPNDAISEIKFTTGNFGAQYGNGLNVSNVITKSGTNQFHGSLFEYVENDVFDSSGYFTNLYGEKKPALRWNMYGGSVGGPIKRNKAFFFFTYENNPTHSYSSGLYSFPDAAIRQGDFSELLTQSTPTVIYNPYSLSQVNGQSVRTPLTNNVIPSSLIDPVAQNIEGYFPTPNLPGIINNYYYSGRGTQSEAWINGRVDYNLSSNNRLNGSILSSPETIIYADPRPENIDNFHLLSTQAQVSDIWTLSPTVVNEVRLSGNNYGETGTTPSVGQGYPQKLGLVNTIYNIFPVINIGGSVGGSGIGGGVHTVMSEGSFVPSDILTWIKGKHILKFGGEYDWFFTNSSTWGDMSSGNFSFSGLFSSNPGGSPAGTSNGLGYADFLFGTPNYWSVGPIGPYTGSRVRSAQMFAQDDYKVKSNLTLNLGVRWVQQGGWTEDRNRLASFDPNLMNPATGTLGAIWYAGQDGRRALQNSLWDVFSPRVGFAWSPKPNWAVRGGFGIYDVMWDAGNYQWPGGGAWGWSFQGVEANTDSLTPIFTMGPTPAIAASVYPNLAQGPSASAIIYPTNATRTPELLNGQSVSYSPANTPMGYMEQGQLSIQHQMGSSTVFSAAYIFTRGVHLTFYRDINQVPADKLGPGNAQLNRPYPQYQGISAELSDGISNYDALQLSFQRYVAHGLTFMASYTMSKSLDNGTGSGWTAGVDNWQISADPMSNYGLSANDETHMMSASFVYQLPFGAGKHFLGKGGLVNGVVGGWQLSSMMHFNIGLPITPVWGGVSMEGSLAGTLYPNRVGSGSVSNPSINGWFNTSAFVDPAPYTFGNSGRDILRAPGYKDVDLALAKDFPIRKLGETGKLQIRIDATNAFNFTNWSAPDMAVGSYGAGQIWGSGGMRQAQLGARLTF